MTVHRRRLAPRVLGVLVLGLVVAVTGSSVSAPQAHAFQLVKRWGSATVLVQGDQLVRAIGESRETGEIVVAPLLVPAAELTTAPDDLQRVMVSYTLQRLAAGGWEPVGSTYSFRADVVGGSSVAFEEMTFPRPWGFSATYRVRIEVGWVHVASNFPVAGMTIAPSLTGDAVCDTGPRLFCEETAVGGVRF